MLLPNWARQSTLGRLLGGRGSRVDRVYVLFSGEVIARAGPGSCRRTRPSWPRTWGTARARWALLLTLTRPPPRAQPPRQSEGNVNVQHGTRGEPTSVPTWLEDPHFNLDALTPGQRYTALLSVALVVLLVTIGVPRSTRSTLPPGPTGGSPSNAVVERLTPPSTAPTAPAALAPPVPPTATTAVPPTWPGASSAAPPDSAGASEPPAPSPSTSTTTTTTSTTMPCAAHALPFPVGPTLCGAGVP